MTMIRWKTLYQIDSVEFNTFFRVCSHGGQSALSLSPMRETPRDDPIPSNTLFITQWIKSSDLITYLPLNIDYIRILHDHYRSRNIHAQTSLFLSLSLSKRNYRALFRSLAHFLLESNVGDGLFVVPQICCFTAYISIELLDNARKSLLYHFYPFKNTHTYALSLRH